MTDVNVGEADVVTPDECSDLQIQVWQSGLWKKNILGNQTELLQKGSENTWEPLHPSMTTTTPLVMTYVLKTSALWDGGPRYCQILQRSITNKSQWPIPKQKYRQVSTATYMGLRCWSSHHNQNLSSSPTTSGTWWPPCPHLGTIASWTIITNK